MKKGKKTADQELAVIGSVYATGLSDERVEDMLCSMKGYSLHVQDMVKLAKSSLFGPCCLI